LNFVFQAKDKHGISALLAAIWEGHTDCVKLLLEQVSPQTQQYSVPEPLLWLFF
jgi:ankyrin repeat protein